MKNIKKIVLALCLLAGFVAACGNNPQVSLAEIPVYQQPTETPEPVVEGTPAPTAPPTLAPPEAIERDKQNKPIQTLLQELEAAAQVEGMELAVKIYKIPNAVTWDEVVSYYSSNLGSEWKVNDSLNLEGKKDDAEVHSFKTTGWTYEAQDKEQIFVVGIIVDQEEKKFLMIALFTEK